jgi:hypothetical protein
MEHLGQHQGIWVSQETLVSATKYLDKLPKTWVSLKVFGSAMKYLCQP